MIKVIQKNGLILAAFALVTTSIIAITYAFTHERIAQAKERALLTTLNQVVNNSMHDNDLHLDCIIMPPSSLLGDKSQRIFRARLAGVNTALIVETRSPNGYSGNIDMVVAIDTQRNVIGARVVAHKETPGLGDKVDLRVSDWILGFNNMPFGETLASRWQVKKDGGQFDQFTGATITPRAVVSAIYNAALYGDLNMQELFSLPSNCLSTDPQSSPLIASSLSIEKDVQ